MHTPIVRLPTQLLPTEVDDDCKSNMSARLSHDCQGWRIPGHMWVPSRLSEVDEPIPKITSPSTLCTFDTPCSTEID